MSKHVELPPAAAGSPEEIAFREGLLVGILVGEGHFGGDGKQPQITLRMHVRHERLFDWIEANFPGGKRFGPYSHGGRHYFQWMARGTFLRERLMPILERRLGPTVDAPAAERYREMVTTYHLGPHGVGEPVGPVEVEPARLVAPAARLDDSTSTRPGTAGGSESLDSDHI